MTKTMQPLAPTALRRRCNPRQFDFVTTDGLMLEEPIVGQERAVEAISFGLDMNLKGYNIYVMGYPGLGMHNLTRKLVIPKSRLISKAMDWCYVYNFDNPLQPKVLRLSPGLGKSFKDDMEKLIDHLHEAFSVKAAVDIIRQLRVKYDDNLGVVKHLNALLHDIREHEDEFFKKPNEPIVLFDQPHLDIAPYSRLKVNLFVDNSKTIGRPVIFQDNPIYHNLVGKVENISISGSLLSDFTLIRPGALHKANNGYLVLDAHQVLSHHLAWESLKRSLHQELIKIEPLELSNEFWSAQTLQPEAIPLDVKVILIGDRETYYILCEEEPDFPELFKVVADFENDIPRTPENNLRYAKMLGSIGKEENLRPLHRTAVASVIDYSSRLVEDTELLSGNIHAIKSIVQQADYWSSCDKRKIINKKDIVKAIAEQNLRYSREKESMYKEINRGIIQINLYGKKVGQLNGLTVTDIGGIEFGLPAKITCTSHLGDGNIIDIQREIDLSGAIHTKGIFTLISYLKSRYITADKLSLSASISFEQLYSSLEGDSASAAELCVLLSALSRIPLKQSLALTGSINQFGELQHIGSVNSKIEGYFDVCAMHELNGEHGVIIPRSNVKSLMLKSEVVRAAREGLFHVYAVNTIDEAMSLLTDMPAGERDNKGRFPKDSVNYEIEDCLLNYAKYVDKSLKG